MGKLSFLVILHQRCAEFPHICFSFLKRKHNFRVFFFAYSLKSFGNNYGKKKATAVKSNAASELVGSLLALQATSAVTEHGELGQELGQQGSKVEPSKINPKP